MSVRFEVMTPEHEADLFIICQNLRAHDREEIFATRFGDNPAALCADTMRIGGFSWIFYWNDKPTAVIGGWPVWDNHWTLFAYATDDFRHVIISLTRLSRSVIIPTMLSVGVQMAHAWAMVKNKQAIAWLKSLGGHEAARVPGFGKQGQDFVMMVWRP